MASVADKTLRTLTSFLQIDAEQQQWAEPWTAFRNKSSSFLEDAIYFTEFPKKHAVKLAVDSIANRICALARFPQLSGRRVVCHIGRKDAFSLPLKNLGLRCASFWANCSIPTVLTREETLERDTKEWESLGMVNPRGGLLQADGQDICKTLDEIAAQGGELRTLFAALGESLPGMPEHLALVDIPCHALPQSLFLYPLLDVADDIVISPCDAPIFPAAMQYIQQTRPGACVYIASQNVQPESRLLSRFSRLNFKQGLPQWPEHPVSNSNFPFFFKCAVQEPLSWLESKMSELDSLHTSLTSDLVMNSTNESLNRLISQMREKFSKKRQEIEEQYRRCLSAKDDILAQTLILEERFSSIYESRTCEPRNRYTALAQDDWREAEFYLQLLIQSKNRTELSTLVEAMHASGYPHSCVLEAALLLAREKQGAPEPALREVDRPLGHRLCIRLRHQLGLDDVTAGREHAAHLNCDCQTGEEWYLLGLWQELQNLTAAAADSFRKALQLGERAAGARLYQLLPSNDPLARRKSLNFLAKFLEPEACHDLALELKRGRWFSGKSLLYLYIAAGQHHVPSLLLLAAQEFYKSHQSSDEAAQQCSTNALRIYAGLYGNGAQLSSEALCNFGLLLHQAGDFERSMEVLAKSQEPLALRTIGRMYHYGDGVCIDLETACRYYEKALDKGDVKAEQLLAKAKDQIQKHEQRDTYRASKRYSSSSSSTYSGSSGGCFLTTATCRVMGFADDCDVLETYRWYRDNVLTKENDGLDIISQYYKVAPVIVQHIDALPESHSMYRNMWENYLEPGYKMVLKKDFIKAKELYISLVTMLMEHFHITMEK